MESSLKDEIEAGGSLLNHAKAEPLSVMACHAPIPGLTRLANPNRFRGAKPYTGTLYLFFFFFFQS